MKYASIIVCHYSKIDDFGEKSAGVNPPARGDLLKRLILSIHAHTDYPSELIVLDNGGDHNSNSDTLWLLEKVNDGTVNTIVRYKENRHFAYSWNEGARIATGDYLVFVCNDIEVAPGWLSACIKILDTYSDRQYVATPFITYDKTKQTIEITPEGYRVNTRAGSNCMVVRRSDWEKLGEFPIHRIGGSLWYTKNFRAGWRFVAPPEDLARDNGWRHGVNFTVPIVVKKTLLGGDEIHFEERNQ